MNSLQSKHEVIGLPPAADRYNTNPAGDVVSVENFSEFMAHLIEGAGGTGTAKLQIEACDDFVPTNTVAVDFKYQVCQTGDTWSAMADAVAATGYTTVAGADKQVKIFVEPQQLPEGYNKLRIKITEVANDPCLACVVYTLGGSRFRKAIHETAIA